MKIIVIGTRGIPNIMGGVETHCEELYPRIVNLGEEVTIIRRSSYVSNFKSLKNNEWKGVKFVDIDAPKKKAYEAIIHTFKAINKAKMMGADILHIHSIGPAILTPYAKLLGLKVVFTHHGPDYDRDKWGKIAKFILKLGEKMGCKFADEIIVISKIIKEIVIRKYGKSKNVHLIYNGVSGPNNCYFTEYFDELGIEKHKYILSTCRFVPEKKLHDLIEAFCKCKCSNKNKYNDIKLVLAGDSDFEDEYSLRLKKMAKDNGVILTGFIKGRKLHSLLSNCLCFCLPSSHEGLPISLLEAMSYNVPVLVSDIPANIEIGLNKNYYFPCGNVEILANKLSNIINKPFHKVEYNMEKYDWNKIAFQVDQIYKTIKN